VSETHLARHRSPGHTQSAAGSPRATVAQSVTTQPAVRHDAAASGSLCGITPLSEPA
jgi:transposase, IS30 family